jgi:S1-C subfamily serine protease
MQAHSKLTMALTAFGLAHGATTVHAQDAVPTTVDATPSVTSDVVVAVPAAMPTPASAAASTTCAEEVHVRASAAVMRVQSGTAVGSGFLVLDGSHVVTSFHTVRDGHEIRVVDHEGNTRSARIVVTAPDDDLALLLLATPLSAEPLAIAEPSSVHVGEHIVALGHPWIRTRDRISLGLRGEGLFEQTLSEGIVSAMGPRALQTDVQLAEGSVGGPVVDCEAHVVGAVSLAHLGMQAPIYVAASALAVNDLVSRAAHEEGYGGRITPYFGLGLGAANEDPGMPYGLYGLVGLNVFDSFVVAGRFHFLMQEDSPSGSEVLSVGQRRYRGDAYVGWRQLITLAPGMGFHFELGAGASVTSLHTRTRSGLIDNTGAMPILRISDVERQRWAVRPMLVLNVDMGPFMIGYTVELDIDTSASRYHVQHVLDFGARF